MLIALLSLIGGVGLLVFGAEGLVRGASSLARRLGLSPLLIGLTVVAYGTSAPELVVSLQAAIGGNADIAIGNVVGSNIANIGLILGVTALLRPIAVQRQLVRIDIPVMIGVTVLLVGLLWNDLLTRLEGVILLLGVGAYTTMTVWGASEAAPSAGTETGEVDVSSGTLARDLLFGGGGLLLLVAGARVLVSGAVAIAEAAGVSTTVIGLTVVALGTSLPELATSVVASLRGQSDLVLGNVVGSNIFNILGILGVTASIQPLDASGLTGLDGGVMLGFALFTLPLFWTGYAFTRWESGILLGGYVVYLGVLVGAVL